MQIDILKALVEHSKFPYEMFEDKWKKVNSKWATIEEKWQRN